MPILLESRRGIEASNDLSRYQRYSPGEMTAMFEATARKLLPYHVVLDINSVLCSTRCPAFTPDGDLIYLDSSHISLEAAVWVADTLAPFVRPQADRLFERLADAGS